MSLDGISIQWQVISRWQFIKYEISMKQGRNKAKDAGKHRSSTRRSLVTDSMIAASRGAIQATGRWIFCKETEKDRAPIEDLSVAARGVGRRSRTCECEHKSKLAANITQPWLYRCYDSEGSLSVTGARRSARMTVNRKPRLSARSIGRTGPLVSWIPASPPARKSCRFCRDLDVFFI